MDNLPARNASQSDAGGPNQNNPYQTQPPNPAQQGQAPLIPEPPTPPEHPNSIHSEVAQHRPRDEHGHFLPYEHPNEPQVIHNPQTSPNSQNLSPPISLTENTKYSEKDDPPMVDIKVTNPVTYFKRWVDKFLKNQDIDLHLRIRPFAAVGLLMTFSIVGGTAFSIGRYIFPNSSPIFHRQVVYPGTIQKGDMGQYFLMYNSSPWKLKPKNNINLSTLAGKPVIVTGNLTTEPNLIEVSEVIVSDAQP